MTLAERLTAIKAEFLAARKDADEFRRLAGVRQQALVEARRNSAEAERGEAGGTPDEWLAREVASLRERADAASERAGWLAEQIEEIETHLSEAGAGDHAELVAQIEAVRDKLDEVRVGRDAGPFEREADEQALLRHLQSLRERLLRARAEGLARDYLAAARQLVRAGVELKAYADFARVFGMKLHFNVDDLRIPPPQGDLPPLLVREAEGLRVDAGEVLAAKTTLTATWADFVSD
jgi:hypothetical protein